TRREAARQLGLSEGTLSSQLTRARRLLAGRLGRRGLALSGGALGMALCEGASAAVPAALVVSTVQAAVLVAAGRAALVGTPAAALMKEVLQAMLTSKLKFAVAAVMVAVLLGAGGLAYHRATGQDAPPDRAVFTRPATDLEVLRREVEILKLQVEVLQEKVR